MGPCIEHVWHYSSDCAAELSCNAPVADVLEHCSVIKQAQPSLLYDCAVYGSPVQLASNIGYEVLTECVECLKPLPSSFSEFSGFTAIDQNEEVQQSVQIETI